MSDTKFITDRQIYEQVIQEAVPSATRFLWLATADLKDLHVESGRRMVPFLEVLAGIVTTEAAMVQAVMDQFDRVWMGAECEKCRRKRHCADYTALLETE